MLTQEELDFIKTQQYGGGYRTTAEDYYRYNPYNPETGQFEGLGTIPPWEIASTVQQRANLGTWQYQQRLMDQGIGAYRAGANYLRGSTGLLNSYRPGGGAALEAGIYSQTAGAMQGVGGAYFQKAAMTQPLDYMFDYRRNEQNLAQMRLNRANEFAQITAYVNPLVSLGPAVVNASSSGTQGPGQTTQQLGLSTNGGSTTNVAAAGGAAGAAGGTQAGQATGGQQGGLGTVLGVVGGLGASTLEPEGQNSTLGQDTKQVAPGAMDQQQGGQATGPNQGQTPGGGQAMGPQAGGGTGAGGGGGGNLYSKQGDFSPRAHAAASAQAMPPQLDPIGQMMMQDYVSQLYEGDPFYRTYEAAIDARWQQRMVAR